MTTSKYRKLMFVAAIIAALSMLFTMTSISFAAGGGNDNEETTCVDGWVINHREQPVDGTKLTPLLPTPPAAPLKVWVFGVPAADIDAAALPNLAAQVATPADLEALVAGGVAEPAAPLTPAAPMTETVPMTETAPLTGTAPMTAAVPMTETAPAVVEAAPATWAPPYWTYVEVDEDGYFKFEDLPADYYYIFALPLPEDWEGIVPQADRSTPGNETIAWTGWAKFEERDAKHCYRIIFKIKRVFDVTVLKWEELLNGTVQPGDGWEITATPINDPWAVKQSGETGDDGPGAVVLTLTPGKWLIKEKVKTGWHPVLPAEVYLTLDQYAQPGATDPVVFKNREPACYGEIVVEKTGLGTDSETGDLVWLGPLAGWKITLSRADGSMYPVSKVTDASGKVTFEDLIPGVYKVKEYVQPGWEAVSDNPQTVVLQDCETARVLFENEEIAGELKITGRKLFKAWVAPYKGQTVGLPGWTITATLKGTDPDEVYLTTTTDALGNYEFSEETLDDAGMAIAGGTITVCEEKRDHWIPVSPTCVDVKFPYPIPATYTGAVVNFTNMQDPPPGAAVPTAPSTSAASCATSHVVQSGQNLSSIAAQYGSSVGAIARANGIANPNLIRAGQALCIP